jgi:hypothetical protein
VTSDQITGILRAILAAVGGFILAKGWISAEMWNWIVGGLLTIAPAVWSWFSNRPASIAASAQSISGVTVTTSPAATADVKAAVSAAK